MKLGDDLQEKVQKADHEIEGNDHQGNANDVRVNLIYGKRSKERENTKEWVKSRKNWEKISRYF